MNFGKTSLPFLYLKKLTETMLHIKRLTEFFIRSLGSSQHGFTKGRSTFTNLLLFTDFIYEAFLEKKQVDVIYVDFSKTFDKVNHQLLLKKLWNKGIRGMIYKWIESY